MLKGIGNGHPRGKTNAAELAIVDVALCHRRTVLPDHDISHARASHQVPTIELQLSILVAAVPRNGFLCLDHPHRMPVAVDIVVGVDARADPCPILATLLPRRMSGVKTDLTVDLQTFFRNIRQEDGCVELLLGILAIGIT